jgi:hypothetical protein
MRLKLLVSGIVRARSIQRHNFDNNTVLPPVIWLFPEQNIF